MAKSRFLTGAAVLLLAGCTAQMQGSGAQDVGALTPLAPVAAANDARSIARHLHLRYRVTANKGDGGCPADADGAVLNEPCYEAQIVLSSDVPLDLSQSAIYFSQVDPVAYVAPDNPATLAHINGDLHTLQPWPEAQMIEPGMPLQVAFTVRGLALNRAKFMPNYYVVDGAGESAVIASTTERPSASMGRMDLPFLDPLPAGLKRAQIDRTVIETPEVTFDINRGSRFIAGALDSGIIPQVAELTLTEGAARVELGTGVNPVITGGSPAQLASALERLASLGIGQSPNGVPVNIAIDRNADIAAQGYQLVTAPGAITIRASDIGGAFYALQSMAGLIRPGMTDIPALEINDAPRFAFRGLQLDIARNFHGPETIRAVLDQMAAYKLNKLHLHLADDEGWRLEIAGLPELTQIGSQRCHDLGTQHGAKDAAEDAAKDDGARAETRCLLPQLGSGPDRSTSGSGFISAAQYVELLQYADARQIEIIPALDMPGHARAAVKAMEARYHRLIAQGASEEEASRFLVSDPDDQTRYSSIQHYSDNTLNVCRPSTYRFVEHVLDELIDLHRQAGTPLQRYHIGADETAGAWTASPLCAQFLASGEGPHDVEELGGYFVARIARMVAGRGVIPAAWSDGLSEAETQDMPPLTQSNIWDTLAWGANRTANRHANRGWEVVLSLPDATYFDLPYAAHPQEGGYYWATRRAPTRKLFSMMPENLPALAAYWTDRDNQHITIDDRPAGGDAPHSPLDQRRGFAGLQGHLWSETIRTRETLGYQMLPRMFALAERAWHRAPWEAPYDRAGRVVEYGDDIVDARRLAAMERDWNRFASIIAGKELAKLELGGWSYRLPPVGAKMVDGQLQTNTAIAGLKVECNTGSGWQPIAQCAPQAGTNVQLRTTNATGQLHSRISSITIEGPVAD